MEIKKNIELSVVVLCYHSASIIEAFVTQLIREINELQVSYNLILVANYHKNSKDITPDVVRSIADKYENIIVLDNIKEGGMGWDMRSGLAVANGNYIAVIDGDGQMPASDIPIVYRIIKFGQYDLVKTYRTKRYDGWIRIILSTYYNILFRILFAPNIPVRDINSKPKIFTKSAYQRMKLLSNDWFTDAEIMIQALDKNMKIAEIGTVFYKKERETNHISFKTIIEFIVNMLKYRFR